MIITLKPLEGTDILRLAVTDPEQSDVHAGESVGYLCPHCRQCDETRHQIWHRRSCPYAGEHGRQHYDDLEPEVPGRPTPELDPEHEIELVIAGESRPAIGVHNGEVVAFRCRCGNLDEDLFEVVHDVRCELADDVEGMTDREEVRVDPPSPSPSP